jgi:2-polyprenyl-3-methyl-5-hydroxy-6-metoxy-1,4-benzoquinol methylase
VPIDRPCPICARDDAAAVLPPPVSSDDLRIVVCRGCGLVYVNPMHTAADKAARSGDIRALHRSRSAEQSLDAAYRKSRSRARRCRDLLRTMLRPGDDVLEVGSGDGAVLAELARMGARPTGIDPDAEAALHAARKLGVPVLAEEFEQVEFHGRQFDALVMVHLIEHFFEPVDALRKARRMLRPGGALFLETPNILRPKVGPRRVFSYAHNYHFSPRTLALALYQSGFTVEALRIFNRDSFQIVARAGAPTAGPPGVEPWEAVMRSIKSHPWRYRGSLQFLWRKLPLVGRALLYGPRQDLAGTALADWWNALPPPVDLPPGGDEESPPRRAVRAEAIPISRSA